MSPEMLTDEDGYVTDVACPFCGENIRLAIVASTPKPLRRLQAVGDQRAYVDVSVERIWCNGCGAEGDDFQ